MIAVLPIAITNALLRLVIDSVINQILEVMVSMKSTCHIDAFSM
jgi:hypothetical protein